MITAIGPAHTATPDLACESRDPTGRAFQSQTAPTAASMERNAKIGRMWRTPILILLGAVTTSSASAATTGAVCCQSARARNQFTVSDAAPVSYTHLRAHETDS